MSCRPEPRQEVLQGGPQYLVTPQTGVLLEDWRLIRYHARFPHSETRVRNGPIEIAARSKIEDALPTANGRNVRTLRQRSVQQYMIC